MGAVIRNLEFWVTIVVGGLLLGFMLIIGNLQVQIATIGIYMTLLLGLAVADIRKVESVANTMRNARDIGSKICQDKDVREFYEKTVESLSRVFQNRDSVFQELVGSKLNEFSELAKDFSMGMISFRAEAWRVHYQKILSQPDVIQYKSVAFVKSEDYWHDETGKYSIKFNYELLKKGKTIERIFIISDSVWDSNRIKSWIREQKEQGILVGIVRESSIPREEDLAYDYGIYGERAVGYQTIDEKGRTASFQFYFNKERVDKAKEQFEKLKIHTLQAPDLAKYIKVA